MKTPQRTVRNNQFENPHIIFRKNSADEKNNCEKYVHCVRSFKFIFDNYF
jgi:hypothetical protein